MPDENQNADDGSTDEKISVDMEISRRKALGVAAAAAAIGGGAVGGKTIMEEVSADVDGTLSWNTTSPSVTTTDDGTITDVFIGDATASDDTGISVQWEGFESTGTDDITVIIEARAASTWDGTGETTYETIASGTISSDGSSTGVVYAGGGGLSDDADADWADVLGSQNYSLPGNHSGMSVANFESDTDGNTLTRTVDVRITINADTNADGTVDATASKTGQISFDVENLAENVDGGGTADGSISA